MFWLEPGPLSSNAKNIVYLCRPKIKLIKLIAGECDLSLTSIQALLSGALLDQIKRHARDGQKYIYTLFLVPRVSTLVSRVLEEEGVLGEVALSAFNLQFITLDDDILSLENDHAFKDIWAVCI